MSDGRRNRSCTELHPSKVAAVHVREPPNLLIRGDPSLGKTGIIVPVSHTAACYNRSPYLGQSFPRLAESGPIMTAPPPWGSMVCYRLLNKFGDLLPITSFTDLMIIDVSCWLYLCSCITVAMWATSSGLLQYRQHRHRMHGEVGRARITPWLYSTCSYRLGKFWKMPARQGMQRGRRC